MTDKSAFYTTSPAAETAYVIQGFLHALAELAPAAVDSGAVSLRAAELEREHASSARDGPSVYHLGYACVVLAADEALAPQIPPQEAVVLLKEAFVRSGEFVRDKTRADLDQSKDAFRELVNVSKQREAQFGASFEFERERDDDGAYLLNVRRCFWHDFFVALGRPELTSVLCEFDRNWFAMISPEHHGFRFERKTTLGYGGACCPFHFFRVGR
jgi:hypothetical protein